MDRFLLFFERLLRRPVLMTAVVAGLWALTSADWLWLRPGAGGIVTLVLRNLVFFPAINSKKRQKNQRILRFLLLT